jgi:5-methyltetrahydropteroyltriglutamate--homocysteine methyltransferase
MATMRDLRDDQVGSLLRPPELVQAWDRFFAGELDRAAVTEIEDRAILEALDRQRATGIGVFTDGEFRRAVYMTGVVEAVEGFVPGQGPHLPWRSDPGREVPPDMLAFRVTVVGERLRQTRRIAAHEAAFLRERAGGPWKITLPSPAHFIIGAHVPGVTDVAYPSRSDLIAHLAEILAGEAGSLAREGVEYLQVDSPTYSIWFDPEELEVYRGWGVDPDGLLDEMIAADNAILDAARAGGAVTALHVCRGNGSGAWLAAGGYEPVAERLFSELRCDRLLLEYDSERAGDFEPLRFVPEPKVAVLGLVSTKYGEPEPRDALLRRIDEAARYLPPERLALSTQCGFASNFRGNPITPEDQWRKLELVASIAREVWG